MLPPVLSGFIVVGKVRPGSCSRLLVPFGALGARDDVRESIDRPWELFEFTTAAAAVYDRTPQRLGRRVPGPYRPQGLRRCRLPQVRGVFRFAAALCKAALRLDWP